MGLVGPNGAGKTTASYPGRSNAVDEGQIKINDLGVKIR